MSKKYTLFSTNVKSNIVGKSNSVFVFLKLVISLFVPLTEPC